MDFYQRVSARPFINTGGWRCTRYGGSIMSPRTIEAMAEASRRFVNLFELQDRVGIAIARMTNNEAAMVSCGAASGILLAVAGCIAGTDEQRAGRLPDTSGLANRVVMFRCHCGTEADAAVRAAGGVIVDVGDTHGATELDFIRVLDDQAAAVLLLAGDFGEVPAVDRIVQLAHRRNVPVLIDGADALPPKENLWRYTKDLGCDLFVTSGGKAMAGPQTTGLVLGSAAMVEACKFHASPHVRIGRGMKVGKEEFAGIYAALEQFLATDFTAELARQVQQARHIAEHLEDITGIQMHMEKQGAELRIEVPPHILSIGGRGIADEMLAGDPSILLHEQGRRIIVRTALLQRGEEQVVAGRLHDVLTERLRYGAIDADV